MCVSMAARVSASPRIRAVFLLENSKKVGYVSVWLYVYPQVVRTQAFLVYVIYNGTSHIFIACKHITKFHRVYHPVARVSVPQINLTRCLSKLSISSDLQLAYRVLRTLVRFSDTYLTKQTHNMPITSTYSFSPNIYMTCATHVRNVQ
jgi:hypothetical protein